MLKWRSSPSTQNATETTLVADWPTGALVLFMVVAPVAGAIAITSLGVVASLVFQRIRGGPIGLPDSKTLQFYGMFAYVVATWIDVAVVWRWASRHNIRPMIFDFRRLGKMSLLAACMAGVIATTSLPSLAHGLSRLTAMPTISFALDLHNTAHVAAYVLLYVGTAPFCEEVLYRGLLVFWLRRIGWTDATITLAGSIIFGANHVLPLGPVWGLTMTGLGFILYVLRLRFHSLTPGWIAHVLFNAQPLFMPPLIFI